MDLRNRKPILQRDFEAYMARYAPEFFDRGIPRPMRMAAFRRVLGTPDAVLNTPQTRLLYTIPYQNGGTNRFTSPDIPRSLYSEWNLRLKGAVSKTESVAGTLVGEGPLTLVRGFRVAQDGDILKDIDLSHLRVLSHHIGRGVDTSMTNISLGTDVAEAFQARVALDFRTLRSENPSATFWPADRYGQITIETDWGSQTAATIPELISGGTYTGVSFSTAPVLEIWGKEILNPAFRARNYWLSHYSQKINSVNAAAQLLQAFPLPVGEIYRGIMISQYTNSPRVPIATLVAATGNVKLRANGTYYKYETTWEELVQKNNADYGIAMPTGYAFIDFMDPDNGGLYESAFRTDNGVNVLEALVDVASVANAFLQFTLVSFKPARNFA